MKRDAFSNCSESQINLLFTMFMAEATDTDPFVMEEELKEKGIIGKCGCR